MEVDSTTEKLPGNGGAYGLRTLRSLRRNQHEPSKRLARKIDTTYKYFLEEVDPVIGQCITHLLCEQPVDVPGAMLNFFRKMPVKKEEGSEEEKTQGEAAPPVEAPESSTETTEKKEDEDNAPKKEPKKRAKKEQKLYLATAIGPIVSKLVNRIALTRPAKVVGFLCDELSEMIYGDEGERVIEQDERFAMYAGMDGPKEEEMYPVPVENPETKKDELPVAITNTVAVTETVVESVQTPAPAPAPEMKKVQFAVLGMNNAGKSSMLNMLQGNSGKKVKPTIGFRPVSMMLGEEMQVRFYDLGGGPKIRDIWTQYYHDVHGVIYVLDASAEEQSLTEAIALFQSTIAHAFLIDKPLLIMANKQDVADAKKTEALELLLSVTQYNQVKIIETSVNSEAMASNYEEFAAADTEEKQSSLQPSVDARVEEGLEWLLEKVKGSYAELTERTAVDSKMKEKQDQQKRLARERKVLKNKICETFPDAVKEECKPGADVKINPDDIFNGEDGIKFLSEEIGEEVAALPQIALDICSMVGYQRMALQIVGGLKVPISKKKDPMSWEQIQTMLLEIREEVGLP